MINRKQRLLSAREPTQGVRLIISQCLWVSETGHEGFPYFFFKSITL